MELAGPRGLAPAAFEERGARTRPSISSAVEGFTVAQSSIAASSGGNAHVGWVLKHRSRSGSMIEHCLAPDSCPLRALERKNRLTFRPSVATAQSLIRIGGFKWGLAYLSLPKNQAKMPAQNRDTATTAKGSAGSQIGTLCMSKSLTNAAATRLP